MAGQCIAVPDPHINFSSLGKALGSRCSEKFSANFRLDRQAWGDPRSCGVDFNVGSMAYRRGGARRGPRWARPGRVGGDRRQPYRLCFAFDYSEEPGLSRSANAIPCRAWRPAVGMLAQDDCDVELSPRIVARDERAANFSRRIVAPLEEYLRARHRSIRPKKFPIAADGNIFAARRISIEPRSN